MPTKKPRKRAYIPPSSEVVNRRERSTVQRSTSTPSRAGARGTYQYPVPTLRRTLRRLPIYFLLIFALQYYLIGREQPNLASGERVQVAAYSSAFVTLLFAPFMHMMDRLAYNRYQKRAAQQAAKRS